jgi:hypothetical protein
MTWGAAVAGVANGYMCPSPQWQRPRCHWTVIKEERKEKNEANRVCKMKFIK